MKKALIVLLLIIFISSPIFALDTKADGTETSFQVSVYDTEGEGLALKELPDINSYRYFLIPEDTVLMIDQVTDDGWGHTNYDGYSGWVYMRYTRIFGHYFAQYPSYGFIIPTYYYVWDTGAEGLELRTKPSSECSTFGPIEEGTLIQVQAIQDNWAYVYAYGYFGWVYMDYLRKGPENYSFEVSVYNTENEGLALKAEPDINSERYMMIPEGEILYINEVTADGWGKTRYYGLNYGWVFLQYTKNYGGCYTEGATYGYINPTYYTIINTNGEGLELRCKPTQNFTTYGEISDGTDVLVLAIQESWAFVYYDWHYGWCNLNYLKEADLNNSSKYYSNGLTEYNLKATSEQAKEVLYRYNVMDTNYGCASLELVSISSDLAERLVFPIYEKGYGNALRVYQIMDCHSVDDALKQRYEYFSDEILWPDEDYSKYLVEDNGNVYIAMYAVPDTNSFELDKLMIIDMDEDNVVAICPREYGGCSYVYRLKYQYLNNHLRLTSMEVINGI